MAHKALIGTIVAGGAVSLALVVMVAGASGRGPAATARTATAAGGLQRPVANEPAAAEPAPGAEQPADKGKSAAKLGTQRLHTTGGVVVISTVEKASAADLGVSAPQGATEKESSLWRLQPPKGAEWMLAIGRFTSTAALDSLEQHYRKGLGHPEVRRGAVQGQPVVILSRVKGREAIVVRLQAGGGSEPATILVRRSVKGAPVKIEPRLPGEDSPNRPGQPKTVPTSL